MSAGISRPPRLQACARHWRAFRHRRRHRGPWRRKSSIAFAIAKSTADFDRAACWADRVVLIAPLLDDDLHFLQAVEDLLVQTLVARFQGRHVAPVAAKLRLEPSGRDDVGAVVVIA